jgi:hypothetical protein
VSENKKSFAVKVGDKDIQLAVLRPTHKVQQQAQLVYNRAFREAVKPADGKSGAIVRGALDAILRDQKLWDDAKSKRYEELAGALLEGEKKLAKGRIKVAEARAIAIQMRRDRYELQQLLASRNELDLNTAEAQAENARFNYLVSACTVYADTGKPYWQSEDEYLGSAEDEVAGKAASLLGSLLYNLEDDFAKKLPENSFLLKYGYVNQKLHLVDKKGRTIDAEGRLVDEKGRLINEQGELIDRDGNLLTESGEYKVDFEPFLDEDGKPVEPAMTTV